MNLCSPLHLPLLSPPNAVAAVCPQYALLERECWCKLVYPR